MKANVLEVAGQPLTWKDIEMPVLGKGEALIKIKAAALNRRDYWISTDSSTDIRNPIVLGSDGAGIVTEVFNDADQQWMCKEVVINPGFDWGNDPDFQSEKFSILGFPENGTLAEFVKVPVEHLFDKPAHLSWEQAAAVPLAGVTSYRALFTKAKVRKGEKVLITGIGSGTGSFALQFALATGCKVYVTSGGINKIEAATKMGAIAGVDYKTADWAEQLKDIAGGFDVIIDSAMGDGFPKLVDIANPGGRIVVFGGTGGNIPSFNASNIFWRQLHIMGNVMGNEQDFKAMLAFVNEHKIVPVIDEIFSIADCSKALEKMKNSAQFGKVVLSV